MDIRTTLDIDGAVNWLVREIGRPDARDKIKRHVEAIVRSTANQRNRDELSPSQVRKRLAQIAEAAESLDRLLCGDDLAARAARSVMLVGQAEFNEFRRNLEDLASGSAPDDTEFVVELRPHVEEYNKRVSAAVQELQDLMSENSRPTRALHRRQCASGYQALSRRLQKIVRLATTPGDFIRGGLSPFFAPAEVAKLGMQASTGGRAIESAKQVAAWGCYLLFVELGLDVTDDRDGIFCRFSSYCYEAATGEQDANLSHAVRKFVEEMRRWKPSTKIEACQEKRSSAVS